MTSREHAHFGTVKWCILIVESSSSTPSTSRPPDAPDCGSRSREMYGSRQGFLIFCMIFLLRGRQSGHLYYRLGFLYITESHIFRFFKNGLVMVKIA